MKWRNMIGISSLVSFGISGAACSSGWTDGSSVSTDGPRPSSSASDGGKSSTGPAASSAPPVGLALSDERAERLAGTYVNERDRNIGLRFVSEKKDDVINWSLAALDGREIVRAEGSRSRGVILHFGELTLRMAPTLVEKALASEPGTAQLVPLPEPVVARQGEPLPDSEVVIEGDLTKFVETDSRTELALLSELSGALGDRGLTGDKIPAALPLHAFAMTFSTSSPAMKSAAASSGSQDSSERAPGVQPIFFCTPSDVECCNRTPNDPGCKPEPPKPPPGPDRCEGREPVGSGCYGMCGTGCNCWPNVCGDCCYHPGCAIHDSWCRACGLTNPAACVACYGPLALVGVVAC